jgi:hypothetical protein
MWAAFSKASGRPISGLAVCPSRIGHQYEDREGARPHRSRRAAWPCR